AYWPGFLEAASLPRYFLIGALGGLALLVLLGSARNKASHFSWHPLFGFFVAFFFWASITTAWSPDAGNSLIDISRLAAMIILSFLGMQVVRRPEFTSLLLPAFFGGSLLAAIIGIGQHYGYNPLELRLQEHNIASTFINRNHAAVYFDFVVPSSLVAILLYKNTGYRVLAAATAGAGMAFLLLNKNRGSLLALLVTLTVLTIILWSNRQFRQLAIERAYRVRRHFILALLVPFLVLILPSASSNQAEWNTALLENRVDSSTNIRINAYINTLPLILQQPLTGSGYGGFRMSFRPHATSVRPRSSLKEDNVMGALHNDPLQHLVELGLPGLLLALLIYLATLRIGWPTPDSKQDSSTVFLKLGLFLALLAAGIHSLVDFPLRLPASAALFWFFLGSLVGLAARKPRQRNISPGLQKALLGTVSAYLLFTLVFYFHYFKGSKDLYTATACIQKNDCRTAIDAIENSMQEFDLNYV
ncbi:MAG TPA: hypothetical protein EYP40_10235, partial [Chromatiales bacterium]|nr:hypothetical protein [Chromatiales bacterium]